jgi:hypothetical protein
MIVWETFKERDNWPRIGWRTPQQTVTASSSVAGFGPALAVSGNTFDAWKPATVPAWLQVEFPSTRTISYAGIAAHTAGSSGATVNIQYWNGSAFVNFPGCGVAPTNNDPVFWLTKTVQTTRIRLTVADAVCEVGVFNTGRVTEFVNDRRATYLGSVGVDARVVEWQDNMSVTGEKLGRTKRSDGLSFAFAVPYLPETWAADEWPDLQEHCLDEDGLFLATRPSQYPNEVYYAWNEQPPTLERTYPNKTMSRTLAMQLRGYKAT